MTLVIGRRLSGSLAIILFDLQAVQFGALNVLHWLLDRHADANVADSEDA
jgi:hypothetical protein